MIIDMDPLSASKLDGFTGKFFHWEITGIDVI